MSAMSSSGLSAPGSIHTFVAAGEGGEAVPRGGWRGGAASRVAGGLQAELARGAQVQQPGRQHPIVDDGAAAVGDPLAVERLRAQAALAVRVVGDRDRLRKDPL